MGKTIMVTVMLFVFTAVTLSQSCPSSSSLTAMFDETSQTYAAGWESGASIPVYIVSNSTTGTFSSDAINAIETAFANWNADLSSELSLSYNVVSSMPSSPSTPYVQIQYGDTSACGAGQSACTITHWNTANGYITYSTMTVSTDLITYQTYQTFAHEVGHTYGVADCTASDCSESVTVMEHDFDDRGRMGPTCCDKKLMYNMTGDYGSPSSCTARNLQGTAFLDSIYGVNGWSHNFVSATFQQSPRSGSTVVVGCMNINYKGSVPSVTDNQSVGVNNDTNTYTSVAYTSDRGPVALFIADSVVASQGTFTVTCSLPGSSIDAINVFALEYTDLAPSGVDNTCTTTGNSSNPLSCSVTTTATNDLIATLYNNWTSDDPAGIAPTSSLSIPPCYNGEDGNCAAQNGDIYEVGAMATSVASSSGTYNPGFYGPSDDPNARVSCASASLKVIGP